MTNFATPKEQQTAYERWEMSSFPDDFSQSRPARQKPEKNTTDAGVLAKIIEGARKEAYEKGIQEGFTVGMAKAREQALAEKLSLIHISVLCCLTLQKKQAQMA